jgi:hypothetical protein
MIPDDPATRRKARTNAPAFGFLGGIVLFATALAAVLLVIWALG